MHRVNSFIVGYDVATTATTVNARNTSDDIVAGEVVVLGKDKLLLPAGSTITDSDVIYIGVGGKTTYTDAGGETRRTMIYSAPIQGAKVKSWTGISYNAVTERVITFGGVTGITPVAGTEYVLRIEYLDMQTETPAQFVQEYRVVATAATTTVTLLFDLFKAAIAADAKNTRITVNGSASTLILTAQAVPQVLNQVDNYWQLDFDAQLTYVDTSGIKQLTTADKVVTAMVAPHGFWAQVRDDEKRAKAYNGITNYTWFPVPSGMTDWFVNDGGGSTLKTYDYMVIEHNAAYASPDNNYEKEAKLATVIATPVNCTSATTALGILNTWMASCPGAFAPVSI